MKDKKSLVGAWMEAARPRTLPASVSPVLLGSALAYYDGMDHAEGYAGWYICYIRAGLPVRFVADLFC